MVDNQSKSLALSAMEVAFSITAFFLCWIGSLRCDFIKFTDTTDTLSLQFGLWRYQGWSVLKNTDGTYIFESCNNYPAVQEIDPTWKTAQAFAIIAFIFAFVVLIASCVFTCAQAQDQDSPAARTFLAPLYLLLTIFQGLSLLLLSSNACNDNVIVQAETAANNGFTFPETCSLNTGANIIISATVFWFAAALASLAAARTAKKAGEGEAAQPEAELDVELAEKVEAAKAQNEEEAAADSGVAQ